MSNSPYIKAVLSVLPVSTKHHTIHRMVLFPTKFCFFSFDPIAGAVLENVAHRQLEGVIKADPALLAKVLGVSVTPVALTSKIPDRPGWKLLLSVKNVPLCWVFPYKLGHEVRIERIEFLTVEEFLSITQKDDDDVTDD